MMIKVIVITLLSMIGLGFTYIHPKTSATNPLFLSRPLGYQYPHMNLDDSTLKAFLKKQAPTLSTEALNTAVEALSCASSFNLLHQKIITIIDYSLPSNQKRLWVFDLSHQSLRHHTYVSHGIKSGELMTDYVSNQMNSKSSSVGVYLTQKAYRGREGLSLRLSGLERGFNDRAEDRAIVMHGGWYMEDKFIQQYGRPGRSWGCPALPEATSSSVIQTIENSSLLIVYYPETRWLQHSKFLSCHRPPSIEPSTPHLTQTEHASKPRETVLFINYPIKSAETLPVVALSATDYREIFNKVIPLERMLRRQINHAEYIAITDSEFLQLIDNPKYYEAIQFIIPKLREHRGYYLTEMNLIPLGHIQHITHQPETHQFSIQFDKHPHLMLKPSNSFIRWLGL